MKINKHCKQYIYKCTQIYLTCVCAFNSIEMFNCTIVALCRSNIIFTQTVNKKLNILCAEIFIFLTKIVRSVNTKNQNF